jgi:hypothetical protein
MRCLPILLLSLISVVAYGQTDAELDKIAQTTCDCITKKNPNFGNKSEVEMALGLCMLDAAQTAGVKLNMTDGKAMEELGQKVGVRMAGLCPSVFEAFVSEETKAPSAEPDYVEVSGKVKSVESGDYMTLVVQEPSGKEHRLLWIHYFPGSDAYVGDPKILIGKSVTVSYSLVDVYVAKAKGYVTSKQLYGLQAN